jgi:hypothetical protein
MRAGLKLNLDGTELLELQGPAGETTTQAIADLAGGGGGGSAGSPIVRKFEFTFDTANLASGAVVYTPTIGDLLIDAWIEIDTAWDGTTPCGDVGTFDSDIRGLFGSAVAPVDMTHADDEGAGAGLLITGGSGSDVRSSANAVGAAIANVVTHSGANPQQLTYSNSITTIGGGRFLPAKFTAANPIKVCVSQDGTNTGADPGSTQGAATLYLVTVTPV